jgi:glycosyltransferase involved in cell wall biosynthesis
MAAEHPLVSVVIPSHNYAHFLADAIQSVLAQDYEAIEIMVVDDGSTDDTPSVLKRFDGQVQVVRLDGQGVARARNAGLAASSGEYTVFLDADDLLLPEAVRVLTTHLTRHSETDAVCGAWYACDIRMGETAVVAARIGPGAVLPSILQGNIVTTPSAVMVRRRTLEAVGGFNADLSFTADWEMWIRLAVRGYRFGAVPEPVAIYRIHGGSMTRNLELAARDVWYVLDLYTKDPALPDLQAVRLQACAAMSQYLGKLHLEQGDEEGARRQYHKALAYAPGAAGSLDFYYSMARAIWRHRRLSGSLDVQGAMEAVIAFASGIATSGIAAPGGATSAASAPAARVALMHLAAATVARSTGDQSLALRHLEAALRASWRVVAAKPHRSRACRTCIPLSIADFARAVLRRLGLRAPAGPVPALVSTVMASGGDGRP